MASILTKVAATDLIPAIMAPSRADFELPSDVAAAAEQGTPTPFTIDYDRGVAFGIVAPKGRCLLDGSADCWTYPEDDDLSLSMNGTAELDTGEKIKVGVIAMDLNHAGPTLDGESALDVMSNSGAQLARVRYFHTPAGIAAAGPIVPGVTYGQAVRAEAAAQSGDWRALWQTIKDEGGRYRFAGSIAVNIPGLPLGETYVPGIAASSSGGVMMVGWAHTAASTTVKNHAKAVQDFIDESKKLTEQVKAEREAIHRKYEQLLESIKGKATPPGQHGQKRTQIRQQRSAELEALRKRTADRRTALAEQRKQAMEDLRIKQRSERESFSDKARAEHRRITDGGKDEAGSIIEGFKARRVALQKKFEDLRSQIADEFSARSDDIKDLDKEARPAARRALAAAKKAKLQQLRDRYQQERDALQAQQTDLLDALRVKQRADRNELTDRQRAERQKAKTGASTMTDTATLSPGRIVTLLDGTVARVASLAEWMGQEVLVTEDGVVVDTDDIDVDAKTAACLYKAVPMPALPYNAEVTFPGGRGMVGRTMKDAAGNVLVTVRKIDDMGVIASYDDEVVMPASAVHGTGRVFEYAGHEDSDGVELEGGDRVIDSAGPVATPAQTAAAHACSCGGVTAAMDTAGTNEVPAVADPTAQIALDKIAALEKQLGDLEAKIDMLARSKQEADLAGMNSQVASLRTSIADERVAKIRSGLAAAGTRVDI